MGLKDIFSNSFETHEYSDVKELTTHFYNNTYEETKNRVIEICKSHGYNIEDINDNYKEMMVSYPKGDIIISLFNFKSYYVTSVDFKISTHYFIPFKRGFKIIVSLYDDLNRQLSLKKIGGGSDD